MMLETDPESIFIKMLAIGFLCFGMGMLLGSVSPWIGTCLP